MAVDQAAPKVGRPSDYSQEIADIICERITDGESLRAICRDPAMPAMATVFRWIAAHKELREQYTLSMEQRAEMMFEDIIDIADDECTMIKRSKHGDGEDEGDIDVIFDATAVARNRLRVDARKWALSKMMPKKYGDKITQELGGIDGAPIETSHTITFIKPGNGAT